MSTSFAVNTPAIGYNRDVNITDNVGVSNRHYDSTSFAGTTWASDPYEFHGSGGPARAQVTTSSSTVLINGALCSSLGPAESAIIN